MFLRIYSEGMISDLINLDKIVRIQQVDNDTVRVYFNISSDNNFVQFTDWDKNMIEAIDDALDYKNPILFTGNNHCGGL